MKFIKTIEKLRNLAYDISTNYNVEESLKNFKFLLRQAKDFGIDLNTEVTELNYENNNKYLIEGNLSQNWEDLYLGNWDGHRYTGLIDDSYIYSTTAYSLITNENNNEVLNIIDEVYQNFKALDKESITLSIQDLFDKFGYLKIEMLDNRYLLTEAEKDKFTDWIKQFEDIDDYSTLTDEYKVSTTDILTGDTVYFKIKANQYEAFDEWNDVDYLKKEIIR